MKKESIIIFTALTALIAYTPLFAKDNFIIEMNSDGFSPSEATVSEGDVVIFKNVTQDSRWPASNIHPAHSIYPEFDPKNPIGPGMDWEFKLIKSGTWKFHDHLYPNYVGTIIVTDNPENNFSWIWIENIFDSIKTFLKNIYSSYRDRGIDATSLENKNIKEIIENESYLKKFIKEYGVDKAMARLVEESGGGSAFDCHQESHTIGRTGYDIFGEETFQKCDASCHSGCYHGAMESFLNETGTENLSENIERVCRKFSTNFGVFECLHGVGHGVLAYLNYDLPESINQCYQLKGSFSQSSCFGGVFMENILTGQGLGADKEDHTTTWVSRSDPYLPCNKIDQAKDLQYQCWQMQTSWMLYLAKYNFDVVSAQCLKAPEGMISACFRSFGRDIAGNTLRDPEKIIELCQKTPLRYYNECVIGSLNVIIDFWGPDLKNQASQLCNLIKEPHKNNCYINLIARLDEIWQTREERLVICSTMEERYQKNCQATYE